MSTANNEANAASAQVAPETSGQAPEGIEKELNDYKNFFEGLQPLLQSLESNPELVQAILDGKLTKEFAEAALAGKLTVQEAQTAQAAVDEVKNDVGAKTFEQLSPEKLSELVDEKMAMLKKELTEKDEKRQFEEYTSKFIAETSDFEKYAKEVSEWLDKHTNVTDIRVAYYAVKGELSEKDAKAKADADAAETAKNFLLNAGPGGVQATHTVDGKSLVDVLIADHSNANAF